MRRKDREITDRKEIIGIVNDANVMRIAFFDEEYPYVLPFNFGYEEKDGRLYFYIHTATEGKKNALIERNNKVAFELDNCRDYVQGSITSLYESVVGYGTMTEMTDTAEKLFALSLILKQYGEIAYKADGSCAARTRVYRLTVNEISGKANRGK